jgi:transcriptional regulatory protein RtcR
VHITTGTHVQQICLFLLTEARYLPGKLLQTSPPTPVGSGEPGELRVIDLDLASYRQIAERVQATRARACRSSRPASRPATPASTRSSSSIERVATATRSPILLTGPTGAGKTRLARKIFELKQTRHQIAGRFVELNCATLRGDAAMSAMFGHTRGAFTGAVRERPGVLRSADGGVLFLDEIGELGLDEQAMLLRALEDRTFLPVGSDREVHSDFQLIAGTNRDLRAAVRAGRFRDDLLARIDLWTFRMPSLRERPEDIEPNLDYELERYAQRHGRRVTFGRPARPQFLRFAAGPTARWPGNFRDFAAASSAWPPSPTAAASPRPRSRPRSPASNPPGPRARSTTTTRCCNHLGPRARRARPLRPRPARRRPARVPEARSLSDAGRALFAASRSAAARTTTPTACASTCKSSASQWSDLQPA